MPVRDVGATDVQDNCYRHHSHDLAVKDGLELFKLAKKGIPLRVVGPMAEDLRL